jgi:membrane associated rhomboid family serine protease
VAYMAHIGGFLAGLAAGVVFRATTGDRAARSWPGQR